MPVINCWAVLVAAIASMVIGSIWYGPLFGQLFGESMGMDMKNMDPAKKAELKKGMWKMYLQQFICSLIVAWVFAHVLWAFSVATTTMVGYVAGVEGGFWMWLGFILPVKYGESLWTGKKFKYLAIDLGYWLILLIVMGIILASWTV